MAEKPASLGEAAAKALLARYGIAVPRGVVLPPEDGDPAALLTGLTPPFVLKVMSAAILHKSDVGGVRLNLPDAPAVREARRAMLAAPGIAGRALDGFLAEEMAPRGHEMVVGGLLDARFGPVIMAGLGGVFVEVLADVAFRLCPITRDDARAMLDELRGIAILRGARGGVVADEEAVIDALLRVGGEDGLFLDPANRVAEIDINPLIVSARGAVAADARILLARDGSP